MQRTCSRLAPENQGWWHMHFYIVEFSVQYCAICMSARKVALAITTRSILCSCPQMSKWTQFIPYSLNQNLHHNKIEPSWVLLSWNLHWTRSNLFPTLQCDFQYQTRQNGLPVYVLFKESWLTDSVKHILHQKYFAIMQCQMICADICAHG